MYVHHGTGYFGGGLNEAGFTSKSIEECSLAGFEHLKCHSLWSVERNRREQLPLYINKAPVNLALCSKSLVELGW